MTVMTSSLSSALWPFLFGVFRLIPLLALPGVALFAQLPVIIRLGLVGALAALLAYGFPQTAAIAPEDPASAMLALGAEFVLGLSLAFGVHLIFGVLRFMGRLVDMQIGFAAAGIIDPTTQNVEALLGSAMAFTALAMLFAWNVHHDLLRGLALSMQTVPLGAALLTVSPGWLMLLIGQQFVLGMLLVTPIVIGLLLVDLVVAYASRLMPQVNVYFISLPLKIGIGLVLTSITLQMAAQPLRRMFDAATSTWVAVMGGA